MTTPIPVALKLNTYALPPATPYSDFALMAEEAERLGFDGIYLIDHLFQPDTHLVGFSTEIELGRPFFPDTWSLLPALAATTSHARIGPQVTPMMRMHPADLARAGAAIDWISKGRFVLQVGTGWGPEEYHAFGMPYAESVAERHRRMVEGIRLIDALWRSESPVTFDGEFFSLKEAPLWPKPISHPRPPIWIGGGSARIRQAVAEVGDGWTPAAPHYNGTTPNEYAAGIDDIRTRARALGRLPAEITAAGCFFVVIDQTMDKAREAASGLLRRDIWTDLSVDQLAERGIAFIGTPDDVLRDMLRFVDAGVEYFTVAFMPIMGRDRTIRRMRLFKEVLNALASP